MPEKYTNPEITEVMYRRFLNEDKEVIAIFPYSVFVVNGVYYTNYYMHLGQHGHGDYDLMITKTTPATDKDEDVKDLHAELTKIGYTLKVIQRISARRRSAVQEEAYAEYRKARVQSAKS